MGRSHPFERIMTTEFKIRVVRDLLDRSSGRLLDIGCGAGFVLWHLGRFFDQAFGVDVDSRALALGRAHVDAGFSVGDSGNPHVQIQILSALYPAAYYGGPRIVGRDGNGNTGVEELQEFSQIESTKL